MKMSLVSIAYWSRSDDRCFNGDWVDLRKIDSPAIIAHVWSQKASFASPIDSRNSSYEAALKELEDLLTNKEKLRIQNQTDFLNALSDVGFDYVESFSIANIVIVHIVFRKKPAYRQTDN